MNKLVKVGDKTFMVTTSIWKEVFNQPILIHQVAGVVWVVPKTVPKFQLCIYTNSVISRKEINKNKGKRFENLKKAKEENCLNGWGSFVEDQIGIRRGFLTKRGYFKVVDILPYENNL